jgi:hypothetical protein
MANLDTNILSYCAMNTKKEIIVSQYLLVQKINLFFIVLKCFLSAWKVLVKIYIAVQAKSARFVYLDKFMLFGFNSLKMCISSNH